MLTVALHSIGTVTLSDLFILATNRIKYYIPGCRCTVAEAVVFYQHGDCSTFTFGQLSKKDKWKQAEKASHRWRNNSAEEYFRSLSPTWQLGF